jgi:hypothetical protein
LLPTSVGLPWRIFIANIPSVRVSPRGKSWSGSSEMRRAGLSRNSAPYQLHNVANLPPNSARYRLFYRPPGNTYRLFRCGDDYHAARSGKTKPNTSELPAEYHDLLAWYDQVYSKPDRKDDMENDPVLQMLGVGRELWQNESGDEFVERERREWDEELSPARESNATILDRYQTFFRIPPSP